MPPAADVRFQHVGGGSINETYYVEWGQQRFFCKLNSASKFPQLFQMESAGLELLASGSVISTPAVIDCFEAQEQQVLLLEWIEPGERTDLFWQRFGERLAALHYQSAAQFGLDKDNYMGSVPQRNRQHGSWTTFFSEERLHLMVERCAQKGQLGKTHQQLFAQLEKRLPEIFEVAAPSLLHGDLWSGNFLCNTREEPVLIDPASYYGHRAVDLAMTTLFGGFRRPFYEAYHHHFPLPANYEVQWRVCNLYPLLVHLYLFGSSYLPQIEQTLKQF